MQLKSTKRKVLIELAITSSTKNLLDQKTFEASMSRSEYVEFLIRKDAGIPPLVETLPSKRAAPEPFDANEHFLLQIGKVLAARRMQLKLSQKKVAELAGLHRTYVIQIEKGKRNITLDSMLRLSAALQISAFNLCATAESNCASLH